MRGPCRSRRRRLRSRAPRRTTGIPPPPHATGTVPTESSARTWSASTDLERRGGGNDPPPAAARLIDELPAALGLERPCLLGRVERPNRLRRPLERRIGSSTTTCVIRQATGRPAAGPSWSRSSSRSPPASGPRPGRAGAAEPRRRSAPVAGASFPTCGPFPCVITTLPSRSSGASEAAVSRRRAACSAAVPSVSSADQRVAAERDDGRQARAASVFPVVSRARRAGRPGSARRAPEGGR